MWCCQGLVGKACLTVWHDCGWYSLSEPFVHGDCARVEVPCGEVADDGVKVGLEHQEVAGEGLTEALFEIILNESNESGRHVLLYRHLCSEA